jgi:hypothetical protein
VSLFRVAGRVKKLMLASLRRCITRQIKKVPTRTVEIQWLIVRGDRLEVIVRPPFSYCRFRGSRYKVLSFGSIFWVPRFRTGLRVLSEITLWNIVSPQHYYRALLRI